MRLCAHARKLALIAFALTVSSHACAHKPSDSYLSLSIAGTQIEGQWDIALRDLERVLGLDVDQDGAITWGEVRSRHRDITAYALSRLSLKADSGACELVPTEQLIDNHSDGAYSVLRFTARCVREPAELELAYRLLFDVDPQHRGLLRLEHAGQARTAILSPDAPVQRLRIGEPRRLDQFVEYLSTGSGTSGSASTIFYFCSRCCCPRCWCDPARAGSQPPACATRCSMWSVW